MCITCICATWWAWTHACMQHYMAKQACMCFRSLFASTCYFVFMQRQSAQMYWNDVCILCGTKSHAFMSFHVHSRCFSMHVCKWWENLERICSNSSWTFLHCKTLLLHMHIWSVHINVTYTHILVRTACTCHMPPCFDACVFLRSTLIHVQMYMHQSKCTCIGMHLKSWIMHKYTRMQPQKQKKLSKYNGPHRIWRIYFSHPQLGTHKRAKSKREQCAGFLRAAQRKAK